MSTAHSSACGSPISIRPSHTATPTPTLTASCDTKKRDSRSPASLKACVVRRRSVPPSSRMKRSRSASCSSSTNTITISTMLARPSGPQMDENRCETTSTGVCARGRSSTGTAPDAVSGAPSSVARAGAEAAPASAPSRLIMRPVSPCITRPSVTSCTSWSLSRMVDSYCGRPSAIATTCETITAARPPTRIVSTTTEPSTAVTCERTTRRSLRTSGAISRLRITASVIGTSTSRPKYSNPSTTAPLTRPPAWNFVGRAGGAGGWGVTDGFRGGSAGGRA